MEPGERVARYSAVVDRIEDGGLAVLLVGDERQVNVPVASLPAGVREGDWLWVVDGASGPVYVVDVEGTRRARERVGEKMERLRRRGRREPEA